MKTFQDCKNWGGRLCDIFVRHLYEPIEGSIPIYWLSSAAEEALSICAKCPNYEKKSIIEKGNPSHDKGEEGVDHAKS
jgi:hypothetical protein